MLKIFAKLVHGPYTSNIITTKKVIVEYMNSNVSGVVMFLIFIYQNISIGVGLTAPVGPPLM